MGVDPFTISAGIAAAGFVTSQIQRSKDNKRAQDRANEEAALIEEQTAAEIRRREEITEDVIDAQRLAILNSGTLIDDSPLMLIEETRRKSIEEIESFKSVQTRKADLTRKRVRGDFLGGIVQDFASGFNLVSPFLGKGSPTKTVSTQGLLDVGLNQSFQLPATGGRGGFLNA